MADFKNTLSLDVSKFNASVKTVLKSLTQVSKEMSTIVSKGFGKGVDASSKKASSSVKKLNKDLGATSNSLKKVGNGSKDINKVSKSLNKATTSSNKYNASLKKVSASTKKAAASSGLLGKGIGGLQTGIMSMGAGIPVLGNFTNMLGGLSTAALGVGAAFVGIGVGISKLWERGRLMDDMADGFERAFKLVGKSGDDLNQSINNNIDMVMRLNETYLFSRERIAEFATQASLAGLGDKGTEELTKLGIAIETASGGLLKGEMGIKAFVKGLSEVDDPKAADSLERLYQTFPQLKKEVENVTDPMEKIRIATEYFGGSLEALEEQANRPQNALIKLKTQLTNSFDKLAQKTFPLLSEGIAILADGLFILLDGFIALAKAIGWVGKTLYKIYPILIGIGVGFAVLNASLIASKISIKGFITQLKSLAIWTKIMSIRTWIWNVALNSNPIGLVVVAIGALIGGIFLLANELGGFGVLMDYTWGILKIGWEYIKAFGKSMITYFITPFKVAYETIVAFVDGITKVWNAISSGDFSGAVEAIGETAGNMGKAAVGAVEDSVNDIKGNFVEAGESSSAIWNGIDDGKEKTKELTEEQNKYRKEVEKSQKELKKVTDEYNKQVAMIGEIQDKYKEGFDADVQAYKSILKIKYLSDRQYEQFRAGLNSQAEKDEADKIRRMNDADVKAFADRAKASVEVLKKQKKIEANIDNEFSLTDKKNKIANNKATNKTKATDTLSFTKSLNEGLLKLEKEHNALLLKTNEDNIKGQIDALSKKGEKSKEDYNNLIKLENLLQKAKLQTIGLSGNVTPGGSVDKAEIKRLAEERAEIELKSERDKLDKILSDNTVSDKKKLELKAVYQELLKQSIINNEIEITKEIENINKESDDKVVEYKKNQLAIIEENRKAAIEREIAIIEAGYKAVIKAETKKREAIQKTLDLSSGLGEGISGAFSNVITSSVDIKKSAQETIKGLRDSKDELMKSYSEGSKSQEEFLNENKKINESIKEQEDILAKNEGWSLYAQGAIKALSAIQDKLLEFSSSSIKNMEKYNDEITTLKEQKNLVEQKLNIEGWDKESEAYKELQAEKIRLDNEYTAKQQEAKDAQDQATWAVVGSSIAALGELVAAGEDSWQAYVATALDGLLAMVPIYAVEIFGLASSMLGPIAGPIIASALIATMMVMSAQAKASAQFLEGGLSPGGTGQSGLTSSGIKYFSINEDSKPEYVVNSKSTKKYKEVLDLINKDELQSLSLNNIYGNNGSISINNDSMKVEELLGSIIHRLDRVERAQLSSYNRSAVEVEMTPLTVSGRDLEAVMKRAKRRALKGLK